MVAQAPAPAPSATSGVGARQPFYRILYVQVLVAIVIGALLGHLWPHTAVALKPLGDGFIKLIKMLIPFIIFCTVVSGIAGMRDMKSVGALASGH